MSRFIEELGRFATAAFRLRDSEIPLSDQLAPKEPEVNEMGRSLAQVRFRREFDESGSE